MSDESKAWRTTMYGILTDVDSPGVFILSDEAGDHLPWFDLEERGLWVRGEQIRCGLADVLGVEVNLLYRAHYTEDKSRHQAEAIYVLEACGKWPDACCRYVRRDDLLRTGLVESDHGQIVEKHLTELGDEQMPVERPPWARAGWYEEATTWLTDQLTQHSYVLTEPIELGRTWNISCVLRASTEAGRFFFKAGPAWPLFVNEGTVMVELAKHFPKYVPMPLCIHAEKRWMLLPDCGEPKYEDATQAEREAMLTTFAQMQLELIPAVEDLLTLGVLDRRLPVLAGQIEPLMLDPSATRNLNEQEISRLIQLIPVLKTRCDEAQRYTIPETLVHGDLHTGNVTFAGEQPTIFDWTDACIAHPFFDPMLEIIKHDDPDVKACLRDSYLSLWTGIASAERLIVLWKLVEPLFILHHAVSYQYIVAHMEESARHELKSVPQHLLRELLKCVED